MNWADLPKDWIRNDPIAQAKAVHMIRRGKTDAQISNYLGMVEAQVRGIRRNATSGKPRGRPPRREA